MLTWAMHLTLIVPGLLWPREILRDTTFDLPLPALSRLLGRGRRWSLPGEEGWQADAFDLDEPLPAAALRLLGDGGWPGDASWLCLDPVHLRVAERLIIVDDPSRLALTPEEDAALRQAVAPLFESMGELVVARPGHWHLRLSSPAAIETSPLPQAAGRAAEPTLPGGADGPAWRKLLAEAQPLLHAHPVNRAREADGRPTVNTLWPWGPGRLPAAASRATRRGFERIWADEPVLRGLAVRAGISCETPPARFTIASGRVLARLDHLSGSLATFDAMSWREALATMERDWLVPALAALRSGRCGHLTLIATGHGRAMALAVARRDLWRFWRPSVTLANWAS
jgi:hypothetical protein